MSTRPEAVPFPPRELLLHGVKAKLAEFRGTVVTLRQLYYRLVAAGIIPNNYRSYKNLGAALTVWRRSGVVPISAFEDRTRGMATYDSGEREYDPEAWAEKYLRAGVAAAKNFQLARWYGQPKRVMIAVEKQALEGPFAQVCEELGVDLAVCRGYPSLSFLAEAAGSLTRSHKRDNVLLYFGDFDPSGLDIPRAVEEDLSRFFGQDFEFHRIALTADQAQDMDLIPAPVKTTDSRSGAFQAQHGEEVFELDAIPPDDLQQMIRDAVGEHFDEDLFAAKEEKEAEGLQKIDELLKELEIEKFLDNLKKVRGKGA